jgi:hypothetical protein
MERGAAANVRFRPIADIDVSLHDVSVKNIQVIDGAANATFSIFQATEDEFAAIFHLGREMGTAEDVVERLGDAEAERVFSALWSRPILKRDALGLHGTLFYDADHRR